MPLVRSNVLYLQDCLLQFYDTSCPLLIECDALKKGLGCVLLTHVDKSVTDNDISNFSDKEIEEFSHLGPVAYSSKSLSDGGTQYANIECEHLGVVFGIGYFKHFMLR